MSLKGLLIAALSLMTLIIAGCGPEDSALDDLKATEEEQLERRKVELAPAVGIYYGTLSVRNQKILYNAKLVVRIVTIINTTPNRTDVTRTASLGGTLFIDPDTPTEEAIAIYSVGDYNPKTGEISLWSAGRVEGSAPLVSMTGYLRGEGLVADVLMPLRNDLIFEGTKIRE